MNVVDPRVNLNALAPLQRVLHDGCLHDIRCLLQHVELAQPPVPLLFAWQRVELALMFRAHVLHVAKPVIDQAELVVAQRREDAAASVVTADDDVPHAQDIDRELNRREAVEVGVHDDIGHVAMDEHLAGKQPDDLIRRHAAVGAADPKILRLLLPREPAEKPGVFPHHLARPRAIVRKEMFEVVHAAGNLIAAGGIPARGQRNSSADVMLAMLQTVEPDLQITPRLALTARYIFAFITVGFALVLDMMFSPELIGHRYAPFIFAIILVAFFGDLGSSLLATLLAIVATNYFDARIEHRVRLDADDLVQLAIFVTIAVSISILTTRRRRAEQQLARANAELRKLDSAKDRFIAAVSHELRTPITVIQGWAQILSQKDGESLRPAAAAAIEQSARAQARLIEDLLDMSRLILDKLQLQRSAVEMADVVREMEEMIRPAAEAKNIEVETRLPPEPCIVDGDAVRLQQILWNLLQNAVKFTPGGGHIALRLAIEGPFARVTVSDDGDGITADLLPFLFDPFRQGDGSASKGGLGLGLAIARQLAAAHGGTIEAHSDGAGRGARFTVRVPLESAALELRSAG